MKIRYLAHASFLITTANGTRVLFDPYESGGYDGALKYGPITEAADIVVQSHDHADHAHVTDLSGTPLLLKAQNLARQGAQQVKGVSLRAVHTYHDPNQGRERGENAMTLLEADGLRLCHAGDLGHPLSAAQVAAVGPLDVLLLPVGGYFTIDAGEAAGVVAALKPRIAIPMHFKTERVDFPIAPPDAFLAAHANVRRLDASELEVSAGSLPEPTQIVFLRPSL